MMSKFLLKGHKKLNFPFAVFFQDFRDFESSYLWNRNGYQQTVDSFSLSFQPSFNLLSGGLSKMLMHKHFKGTKPDLHMVIIIAEHVCDDAPKGISKLSRYRLQIFLV